MLFPLTWTPISIAFYGIFGTFAVLLGFLDYFELLAMRYSKFGTQKGVPSRLGMFVLYSLPILTATIWAWPYLTQASAVQWVVYGMLAVHFIKRTLEVLFVHKYSGHIQPFTFVIIVVTYAMIAGMVSALNARALPNMDTLVYVGIVIFIVGEIGNYYHHKLLADLRAKNDGYYLPHGGWFEYSTCPHYFFELLAWLGIFLASRHLFTLLAFIAMFGYLTARSIKTRQWYVKRFPKYPAKRKYMIPFIF
jgi:very-long-chain enoyl-CoA reductase